VKLAAYRSIQSEAINSSYNDFFISFYLGSTKKPIVWLSIL
jgi:hypothetical protein